MGKDLNRYLTKEDIQMPSRNIKRCYMFICHYRIENKNNYNSQTIRTAKIKALMISNVGKDVEQ